MSQDGTAPGEGSPAPVYEVFTQLGGAGKPLQYVGTVRGADPVLAWQQAKEVYTRREDCTQLWIVPRGAIFSGDPGAVDTLRTGTSRRYRLPAYPSSRRRARAKQTDRAVP